MSDTSNAAAPITPDVSDPTTAADAAAAAPPPEARKYKVKIDADEVEVDEAELVSGYQRGAARQRDFDQIANKAKSVEQFEKLWQENPEAVLLKAKSDPDFKAKFKRAAEAFLYEEYTADQASPEELERRREREELETYRSAERERAERERAEVEAREYQEAERQLFGQWDDAVKRINAPLTTNMVRHMAFLHAQEGLTPMQAAVRAYGATRHEYQEFTGRLDGPKLLEFVGEDLIQKIRQADLDRYRSTKGVRPAAPKTAPKPALGDDGMPDAKENYDAWLDALARKFESQAG